jgi:hypothetical protein
MQRGEMAGTPRLELATSAVTVSRIQVLSTTKEHGRHCKSFEVRHSRVNVYPDVYRTSRHRGSLAWHVSVNEADNSVRPLRSFLLRFTSCRSSGYSRIGNVVSRRHR